MHFKYRSLFYINVTNRHFQINQSNLLIYSYGQLQRCLTSAYKIFYKLSLLREVLLDQKIQQENRSRYPSRETSSCSINFRSKFFPEIQYFPKPSSRREREKKFLHESVEAKSFFIGRN